METPILPSTTPRTTWKSSELSSKHIYIYKSNVHLRNPCFCCCPCFRRSCFDFSSCVWQMLLWGDEGALDGHCEYTPSLCDIWTNFPPETIWVMWMSERKTQHTSSSSLSRLLTIVCIRSAIMMRYVEYWWTNSGSSNLPSMRESRCMFMLKFSFVISLS